jgi:hypothetical protein
MKRWSKQIHFKKLHILLTNHLHLGLSIYKIKYKKYEQRFNSENFHINLWTCQIVINY